MILHRYFPTNIGVDINSNHLEVVSKAVDRCYELKDKISSGGENWVSKSTYNTLTKYNIFSDSSFDPINNFVIQSVKNYCNQLDVDLDCLDEKPIDAWFNVFHKGDYQEYHHHVGSLISVVYFLKVDEDSAIFYFKQPFTDMIEPKYKQFRDDTFQTIFYTPQPGMVLIF